MKCEEQFISELFFLILISLLSIWPPNGKFFFGNVWGGQSQIFSSSSLDNSSQPSLLNSIIIIQAATWRQNVWNSRHSISSTHSLLPCPPAILQLSVSFFLVCTYTAVYKCWIDKHVFSCTSLYYQIPIAIHFIMVLHSRTIYGGISYGIAHSSSMYK